MQVGDLVRIVGIPEGLTDDDHLQTKSLFEACLGRTFPIVGFQGELQWLELHVGESWAKRPACTRSGSSASLSRGSKARHDQAI